MMDRRQFLGASAALAAGLVTTRKNLLAGPAWISAARRYRIGISDIYILKRQTLGAITRAKEIGVEAVEIDVGHLGDRETFENKLLDPGQRKQFQDSARENGIEFCSLGMVGFLAQDFAVRETVMTKMIPDAIATMAAMDIKVAYLPIRGTDLVNNPGKRPAVVERLKATGELAEKAGVVFGIETTLPGAEEAKLLDEVGSPAIRCYFNFKNPLEGGRDLIEELKIFGRDRICQIHCTDEDGHLLKDNPRLDMMKAFETLNEMNYSGWLVMERGRVGGEDPTWAFTRNASYLKSIFQGPDVPPVVSRRSPAAGGSAGERLALHAAKGRLHIHAPHIREEQAVVSIHDAGGRLMESWIRRRSHSEAPFVLKPNLGRGMYYAKVSIGPYRYLESFMWGK